MDHPFDLNLTGTVTMPDNIHRHTVTTKAGNTLSFFYNPDNDLLVVDIIHKNEKGGNELIRKTLDERSLLKHCK